MSHEFRLTNYLARIRFCGAIEPSLSTLSALHAAHVDAIPFEGLDPLLRRPIKLDIASLVEKLIDGRRGGYCFEQNLLFSSALEAMGFQVTRLGGRVRWMSPPDSPLGPRTHMTLMIELPEGLYLADVGFGACVMDAPLQLKTEVEQKTAMGTYRLSESGGLISLSAKQTAGWRTMYVFDSVPQIQSDYELANWYTSTSPLVPFTSKLLMERVTRDKRYKLLNRKFSIETRDGQVVSERSIDSAEELHRVFDETFNITPPVPVADIFNQIGN